MEKMVLSPRSTYNLITHKNTMKFKMITVTACGQKFLPKQDKPILQRLKSSVKTGKNCNIHLFDLDPPGKCVSVLVGL